VAHLSVQLRKKGPHAELVSFRGSGRREKKIAVALPECSGKKKSRGWKPGEGKKRVFITLLTLLGKKREKRGGGSCASF